MRHATGGRNARAVFERGKPTKVCGLMSHVCGLGHCRHVMSVVSIAGDSITRAFVFGVQPAAHGARVTVPAFQVHSPTVRSRCRQQTDTVTRRGSWLGWLLSTTHSPAPTCVPRQ